MTERRVHHFRHLGEELLAVSIPADTRKFELTVTELAVARMAARGLSNAEIARRRRRAVRTIANQVAAILAKLCLSSRAQLGGIVLPNRPSAEERRHDDHEQ